MMRRTTLETMIGLLVVGLAAGTLSCQDRTVTQPESLEAPVDMAVVDGEVCLPTVDSRDATIGLDPLPFCHQGGNGFGLVANQRSDRVGVVTLGQNRHRMVNLDSRQPGVTHIPVGRRPVDVASSGEGTAAIVANQAGGTLTGIDLWTMRPLAETRPIEGTPEAVETFQQTGGRWATATLTTEPNRIEVSPGLECGRPAYVDDRRTHDPAGNCQWEDIESSGTELTGRPVDMAVDEDEQRAWIVYRDRNEISWVALGEEGLGEDEACLGGGVPPCEIERVGWNGVEGGEWGATSVDVDPLGLFVYVLDRPNNRLMVIDRQRRQLVDVSEAIEPPSAPLETDPGIPLVRSATAMSADLSRRILGDGHVLYRLGARVAANNGQLYRVGSVDVECTFEEVEPLSNDAFFFDAEARDASPESACLEHLPELPLGGDPDFEEDDELLDRRLVEPEDADVSLAVTPIFGLRDSEPRESTVRRGRCEYPAPFRDALADADDGEGTGCGTGLAPQPVSPGVEEDLDNYRGEPRADLLTFARALFDENREPAVERSVFDLRVLEETWTVTFEGALPGPGRSGAALVDGESEGLFLSGGTQYCSAGVEAGDRLTIRTEPSDAEGCEVFEADDASFRTYEIEEVRPYELELSVLEDEEDRVEELPTRECFDQGLRYRIRPHEEWTVSGSSSGLISPWERDGNQCVLREGADEERSRIQSRVQTGEEFLGPYLRFRLREGDVDPARGVQYTFDTVRNFSRDARSHVSQDGRPTLPAQVLFTPDLGAGRLVTVVDVGGNRLFLQNAGAPRQAAQYVR